MTIFSRLVLFSACFFAAVAVRADRGPIVWSEGVDLNQESQKAIILYNGTEEILTLSTEMKAAQETEILEFIPFPAEPEVSLANGNPFEEIGRMIRDKGLVFEHTGNFRKGGGSGGTTSPVEIRFSETIGLHDVTSIKINDIEQFTQWLRAFFKGKGIPFREQKFQALYENARDYVKRGYNYFVFDGVKITRDLKFLEPLTYRFGTDKIYFPLKTSNLIGGTGAVEMIFLLPGSITDDIQQQIPGIFGRGQDRETQLSSSAKLYSKDTARICGPEPFFGRSKVYLQVLRYRGPYDFMGDFTYDGNKLVPYAYRFLKGNPVYGQLDADPAEFIPPLTPDERRDMREVFCPQQDSPNGFLPGSRTMQMDCWDFIAADEYAVYEALFRSRQLPGIPRDNVVLEKETLPRQYENGDMGPDVGAAIIQSFNAGNKVSYRLENGFPDMGDPAIRIGDESDTETARTTTRISRVGFNQAGDQALVYVDHNTGRETGSAYFVLLKKTGRSWQISRFQAISLH